MTEIADVCKVLVRPVAMAVVPRGHKWAVRKTGAVRATRVLERRCDAVRFALAAAQVVYVFGPDGRIKSRISNG